MGPNSLFLLRKYFLLGVMGAVSATAWGQWDEELYSTSSKASNRSSLSLASGILLGQSFSAGSARPGMAAMGWLRAGYLIGRGSWNRVEGGLWLGSGILNFGQGDTQHVLTVNAAPMARFSYGYSVGFRSFINWSAALGPFIAQYTPDRRQSSEKGVLGLSGMIGAEFSSAMGEHFEWLAGAEWQHYQFDFHRQGLGGVDIAPLAFNINFIAVNLGIKLKLF